MFRQYPPMTLTLALGLGLVAAMLPLLPDQYRVYNFAAFGALGLFAAARLGWGLSLLLCLGSKLISDFFNYAYYHFNTEYLPQGAVLLAFAIYPVFGRLLKRTENPFFITGTAVLASTAFFLITNFYAWVGQALPYPYTFAGLMECYYQGLPFHKVTFISDLLFTCGLFTAHTVLSRLYFPAERVVPVEAEVRA